MEGGFKRDSLLPDYLYGLTTRPPSDLDVHNIWYNSHSVALRATNARRHCALKVSYSGLTSAHFLVFGPFGDHRTSFSKLSDRHTKNWVLLEWRAKGSRSGTYCSSCWFGMSRPFQNGAACHASMPGSMFCSG